MHLGTLSYAPFGVSYVRVSNTRVSYGRISNVRVSCIKVSYIRVSCVKKHLGNITSIANALPKSICRITASLFAEMQIDLVLKAG